MEAHGGAARQRVLLGHDDDRRCVQEAARTDVRRWTGTEADSDVELACAEVFD
jgi:hypothetical protein